MRKTLAELNSVPPDEIDLYSGSSSLCHREPKTAS